jgi:hypothetical protein
MMSSLFPNAAPPLSEPAVYWVPTPGDCAACTTSSELEALLLSRLGAPSASTAADEEARVQAFDAFKHLGLLGGGD